MNTTLQPWSMTMVAVTAAWTTVTVADNCSPFRYLSTLFSTDDYDATTQLRSHEACKREIDSYLVGILCIEREAPGYTDTLPA